MWGGAEYKVALSVDVKFDFQSLECVDGSEQTNRQCVSNVV